LVFVSEFWRASVWKRDLCPHLLWFCELALLLVVVAGMVLVLVLVLVIVDTDITSNLSSHD